jgi:hypothetical protein
VTGALLTYLAFVVAVLWIAAAMQPGGYVDPHDLPE